MKKYFLVFVAICATNFSASAQLTVSSSGNVTMAKHVGVCDASPTDSVALNALISTTSTSGREYGVYAVNSYQITSSPQTGSHIGVLGKVVTSSTRADSGRIIEPINPPHFAKPFVAGVVGISSSGFAVYGAHSESIPNYWLPENYAGFFAGNVKVLGTVTASSVQTSSDLRLKDNVSDIESSTAEVLSSLRPVSYTFKQDSMIYLEKEEENRLHYGLIAQEVKNILPNIVHEDGAGYLSINYIELIPLLIQAINQQQAQIEDLQDALAANHNDNKQNIRANYTSTPKLYQNNPNPFSKSTVIGYELPLDTHEASIHIYDMNGTEFVAFSIETFGRGELTIDGGTLHAGMYLYSLIADGQLIDTKQMILTK